MSYSIGCLGYGYCMLQVSKSKDSKSSQTTETHNEKKQTLAIYILSR